MNSGNRLRILVVDNLDSFTYNIADYLAQLGADVFVKDRDQIQPNHLASYDGILFSPGPGNPNQMPHLISLISESISIRPTFGICLGFQAIALVFGARVEKGPPMHGKISILNQTVESWLFNGLPKKFEIVRYHSLVVCDLRPPLVPVAFAYTGELMGFHHQSLPIAGVQYHPEAHLTAFGKEVLKNWLNLCENEKRHFL